MTKDIQVLKLRQLLGEGMPLYRAAWKVGMDAKTAQKYRDSDRLPSESWTPKTWRTREGPVPGSCRNSTIGWCSTRGSKPRPCLRIFSIASRAGSPTASSGPCNGRSKRGGPPTVHPRRFSSIRSTRPARRRLRLHFPERFAGHLAGDPFDHLVYHFVETYSNWETGTVCFSESFESLSQGLQNALWELGGVPQTHRTDRLTAAVNNLGDRDLVQEPYLALMAHYGMAPQAIQAGKANQNGDAEQSHNRLEQAMDQALMLRSGRDFADRAAYELFLRQVFADCHSGTNPAVHRGTTVAELPPLAAGGRLAPAAGCGSPRGVRSGSGSNTYSVPSRLIGEQVDVHVMAECLEVWHGAAPIERVPLPRGHNKHVINYRHVIDWLVAKPGAFAAYRHRDAMFPTGRFRRAYDVLLAQSPALATKDYLRILELAAKESEVGVDAALGGSWTGTCRSPRPSSRSTWVTTWACLARWRWSSRRWICRCTTCYSRPGRIFHQKRIDVHESLTDCLRELHLPTIRQAYESAAARARQELTSDQRYLLDQAERECESRRSHRVERLLRESRLFNRRLEKMSSLAQEPQTDQGTC